MVFRLQPRQQWTEMKLAQWGLSSKAQANNLKVSMTQRNGTLKLLPPSFPVDQRIPPQIVEFDPSTEAWHRLPNPHLTRYHSRPHAWKTDFPFKCPSHKIHQVVGEEARSSYGISFH